MHTERNGKWAAANAQAALPRTGTSRALYETELFLRSYTSTVFFVGFTALTIYHLIASEPWYQYIAMTTALVVGSLLSRARRLKLFEGKIVTETVAGRSASAPGKRDIWSTGFKHGYSPRSRLAPRSSTSPRSQSSRLRPFPKARLNSLSDPPPAAMVAGP